ncbi:MAG: bifunctional demethylmenaquinone methyltransferase/2-methoxy-6-polyprenyl-1,4-benzoquinol methylase [Gammaproteobacteria bacterium]|nr:bifunctional demethylmenaquinone methyltransferase/2-methoxy-6-polyprenyl-1,4-benzoquinol methylase [Gammaproteobacteria bacterium]|tara:strand:+ start:14989 stop:15762 length:774 start_codon:yes stop_codon:yes gene_type:complete
MTDSAPEQTASQEKTTHFGYQEVPVNEKHERVAAVFSSVATRYDMMNDVMSLGTHRIIKRFTIELSGLRQGQRVLDLAGGTGDLSMRLSRVVGKEGHVVLADINSKMLEVGRDRIVDRGLHYNVTVAQSDAECLPFANNTFDCVCIAYGLRNVTRKEKALESIFSVLKPGGKILVLEFSKPQNQIIAKAYNAFSELWPIAGKMIVGDSESYRYLVESIRVHPDQETLLAMLNNAGFVETRFHNVLDGISAIHVGVKP